MKGKIKVLFIVFLFCIFNFVLIKQVYAQGVIKLDISSSEDKCQEEKEITVVLNVDSQAYIDNIELDISYDSSILEFVSGDCASLSKDGIINIKDDINNMKKSYNIKFKGKKKGSTKVSVTENSINKFKEKLDNDTSVKTTSKNIEVIKDQVVKSTSAPNVDNGYSGTYLEKLFIYNAKLDTEFKSNQFAYYAVVENDVDKLDIDARPIDKNCKVDYDNGILSPGEMNEITITVRESDDKNAMKTVYKIYAFRKDSAQSVNNVQEEKKEEDYIFEVEKVKGKLCLKGRFEYQIMEVDSKEMIPKGFEEINYSFDDKKVKAYRPKELSSDFVLVYAKDLNTDKTNFYQYDEKEQTFQRFCKDYHVKENKDDATSKFANKLKNKKSFIIGVISILAVFFIGLVTYAVILIMKIRKINKEEFDGQKLY